MTELNCKTEGCEENITCDSDVVSITCWMCSMIDIPRETIGVS